MKYLFRFFILLMVTLEVFGQRTVPVERLSDIMNDDEKAMKAPENKNYLTQLTYTIRKQKKKSSEIQKC